MEVPVTSATLLKVLGDDARSPRWTEFANKYASIIDGFLFKYFPSVDMDQTLQKADALSRMKGDFVINSSHHTASGRTEITVRSHSPALYIVLAIAALLLLALIFR